MLHRHAISSPSSNLVNFSNATMCPKWPSLETRNRLMEDVLAHIAEHGEESRYFGMDMHQIQWWVLDRLKAYWETMPWWVTTKVVKIKRVKRAKKKPAKRLSPRLEGAAILVA